jgi:hypothetical protein
MFWFFFAVRHRLTFRHKNLLGCMVDFSGHWFENQANLKLLIFVWLNSMLLMYFNPTIEFESFKQCCW